MEFPLSTQGTVMSVMKRDTSTVVWIWLRKHDVIGRAPQSGLHHNRSPRG